jgi:AraC-like DNA-binding protein
MCKSAKEYYRYLPVNPQETAWGLSVTGVGYQPVTPGDEPIPKRRHPPGHFYTWDAGRVLSEYAIVYVAHGKGEFDSRTTGSVALQPGDAAVLFPGVWHRYRPEPTTGWGIYWAHFQGSIASRLREDRVFMPECAVVHVGVDEAMLEVFRTLLDVVRADSSGCGLIAAAKTMELLGRIRSGASQTANVPRIQAIVRETRLLLEQDPGGMPVIDDLIQRFDVSRTHFFRAFKQETGQSPYKYHLQLTIRRAGEMLRNSAMSVKQIAFSLGFTSPYHFSKLFKSKMGTSPAEYRRHWRSAATPRTASDLPDVPVEPT